ncbi:MAG: CRTAC1 family protein [Planctomycetota bacterium]
MLLLLVTGSFGCRHNGSSNSGGVAAGPAPGSQPPEFSEVALQVGIDFVGDVGPTFADVVGADPQLMQINMGCGAAVGDYDDDGDLDIYLLAHNNLPNRLYRNDLDLGMRHFTDVTPAALADTGLSRVAHFIDLDRDNDLDVVLINDDDGAPGSRPSRLFRNDGGGAFTDVTAGSNFSPVGYLRAGCATADFDGDGWLDIYVTNWGMDPTGAGASIFPGEHLLYRNLGGFVFAEVASSVGLGGVHTNGFSAIFKDFDGDFDPDLMVAVDNGPDLFYWNNAGQFAEVGAALGIDHWGNDMGVACADFDDDGDLDFYGTNITDPTGFLGVGEGNVFSVNQQVETGTVGFIDEAEARGVFATHWGWGVEFVDAENDGDLDLVAVNGFDDWIDYWFSSLQNPLYQTPSTLFINDGTGQFTRRTGTALDMPDDSRALIAFDYDRDGDQDFLITNCAQPTRLLENQTPKPGHWLTVALRPDALAIGAAVYATVGQMTMRRDVICGRSYLAGTPSEVSFGLGAAKLVSTLRIVWADGTETVFNNVATDQILRVTAP